MTPLQFAVPVGALESVAGELPYVILALLLVSFVTRHLRHSRHERAAEQDADTLSRFTPHVAVSALLVLASFLYMVVEPHSGMVISVLVTGTLVTDFFEFEARSVELRNNLGIERPKAAITASLLTLLYALYISLFWVIQDQWDAII
jgi:hypothetical protein